MHAAVLRYLDAGAAIRIGDRVVTSGQGGVFPPGLPVGVVASGTGFILHNRGGLFTLDAKSPNALAGRTPREPQ